MKIEYRKGNIFNYLNKDNGVLKIVPHVCNNVNGFGSGFAKDISKYYPSVKLQYHKWYNDGKQILDKQTEVPFELGQFQSIAVNDRVIICNMIAQDGIKSEDNIRPLNYYSLLECMWQIANVCISYKTIIKTKQEIVTIKFGSGLAGGDWSIIEEFINRIWIDNDIPVIIYTLE